MIGDSPSAKSSAFLEAHARKLEHEAPSQIADRVEALVAKHEAWRGRRSLNLNPAEGLLSRRCRALLASDLATRLTEGEPGDKIYPHGPLNQHIDEIEATIITLARRLFNARYVEWRPVSNSMANATVFSALLEPGDTLLAQDEDGGGNYSYHGAGPAGMLRLRCVPLARLDPCFEIDVHAAAEQVARLRPKMIVIGGGKVLFPYAVRALREIADRAGAILLYDAAHLGLHISSGAFQRPLEEGAHVVTLSTHKVMGGPVGGLALTNDEGIARRIRRIVFPGFLQTRDLNKYAALAVALAESLAYGPGLAAAMVRNAKLLAAALNKHGFELVARARGYSQTHQIFVDLGGAPESAVFEGACHGANIFISDCALAGDLARGRRSGARIATHEVTRLGMGPPQMEAIAALIARAYRGDDSQEIASHVAQLAARFSRVRFSFDEH